MKKMLSFIMSAAMVFSSTVVADVAAEGEKVDNMVIFGDSISTGYGLDLETEYTYGQICADYLGCNVENYAVDGLDTSELCTMLEELTDEQKQAVSDADVVVVSIGGNDIIHYSSKSILDYAARRNLLKPEYTAEDIPEDPGVSALTQMINFRGEGGLQEYAESGLLALGDLNKELKALSMNLRLTTGDNAYGANEGVIHNQIMPNIDKAVKMIDAVNPDARIIVQTVYQPLQFSPYFMESEYGSGNYAMMLTQLREDFRLIMDTFKEELQTIEGIEIADVLYQFTSLKESSDSCNATPGYAHYFTNIEEPLEPETEGGKTKDIHPNQKGQLAIAATVLDVIGIKNTSLDTLYVKIFNDIKDNGYYPAIAYKTFMNNIDLVPGDVNGDGLTDSVDATAVLSEYALASTGKQTTFDETQKVIGNINHDQFIDSVDATMMMMYYAKLSTGSSMDVFEFLHTIQE